MHVVKWGVQLVASESPRVPGHYNGSTGDIKPGTPNILNSESATIF